MPRAQIKCINKRDHQSPYERIAFVGGSPASNGDRWKWPLDKAIQEIEAGNWDFYVSVGGKEVNVIVSSRDGRKYLKTVSDADEPNNLLSLPECP